MKSFLICGAGLFGQIITRKLTEIGHEVMVIDKDEQKINHILPYATNAVIGDCTNEDFMSTVGVSDFDICFVTISESFEDSLLTTSLLKDLGARMIISRAVSDVHSRFLLRNGATKVVYPEKQLAEWTAMIYSSDHVLDYIELDNDYSIYEVVTPRSWDGKAVGDINVRQKYGINILGIRRDNELQMNITANTVLNASDSLLVLGTYPDVKKCFDL